MLQPRTRKGRRELRALRGQLEIGIAALRRGDLERSTKRIATST